MAKQGKCDNCKTYFSWERETALKKTCCPICAPSRNITLKRTSDILGTGKNPKYTRRHLDKPPLKENYLRI